MVARSGSRARGDTVRRSTSHSRWRRRTLRRCNDAVGDAAASIAGSGVTVLEADDNDVAQPLCKRVLEKAGYTVLLAADGLEAVEVALTKNPAMILMDVAMPGIDGVEAMRRIKAAMPTMPILIASAHSM